MVELIVVAFVVVAGFAVALRFMPRDAQGVRRLPAVIDESVGMHFVRRTLRRPGKPVAGGDPPDAASTDTQVVEGSGAPAAPAHTVPSRFVVSRGTQQAHPMSSSGPPPQPVPSLIVPAYETRRRARSRPVRALAFRGRVVGVGGIAVLAILVLAVVLAPREPGGVLAATGTPGFSASAGDGGGIASPEPTLAATATLTPTPASPTPESTPTFASPTATTGATPSPTARPTPTRAPRSTPKPPTPAPTIAPTPSLAPTPTPSASAAPTPSPSSGSPAPTDAPSPIPS